MREHFFEMVKERIRPGVDNVCLHCINCGYNIYLYKEEWIKDKTTGRITTRKYQIEPQLKVDRALAQVFMKVPCITAYDPEYEKYLKDKKGYIKEYQRQIGRKWYGYYRSQKPAVVRRSGPRGSGTD